MRFGIGVLSSLPGYRRGLTSNQFAMLVISASLVMLLLGIAVGPGVSEEKKIADSKLESFLATAAGGKAPSRQGISVIRKLRERVR